MPVKYTMVAIQNGTTTVTWPNIDSPDTGGTGPHAPSGTLTNIRVLSQQIVKENWQNLDSTLMPGTVQGLWHFDGGLTDSSGNGFTLTQESANPVLYNTIQGLQCVRLSGNDQELLERTVNDASLRITGALSLWMIILVTDFDSTNTARIIGFDIDLFQPDTLDYNTLYSIQLISGSGRLRAANEYDAGVNVLIEADTAIRTGKLTLMSYSRNGSGDATFFVDGVEYGGFNGNLPNGGTNAATRLRVGGSNVGSDLGQRSVRGFCGGLAVSDSTHVLNDHLAMYDYVRGFI